MFYALAGIPLGLIMFQSIGERLNTFTSFIIKHIKKCLKLKDTEVRWWWAGAEGRAAQGVARMRNGRVRRISVLPPRQGTLRH